MPAKWQRWIPFEIDAFFGSPAVQAMHPAAQMGYWRLICAQWQSGDCTVPADPLSLAELSGLGDELWALHGPRILRKFETVSARSAHENPTLTVRNSQCYEKWEEAKKVYESRQKGAQRTNNTRSPSRSAHETGTLSERPADTRTLTGTETETRTTVRAERSPSAGANGEFMLATWLGEEMGLALSRSDLPLIADVIRLEAKARGEPAEIAVQFLRTSALEARGRGEAVTVWWFKDRKFAGGVKINGHTGKGDANYAVLQRSLAEDQNCADRDGDFPPGDDGRFSLKTLLGAPIV